MKHAKSMPAMKRKQIDTSATDDDIAGVEVFVRLRPLVARELKLGSEIKWKYNRKAILEDTGSGTKTRTFDGILPPETNNQQAYDAIAEKLVAKALNGFNVTMFAYGQTGSGKTWTMMGDDDGKYPGVIPLGLQDIFDQAEKMKGEREYEFKVSFMEIYNEQINDLLNPNSANGGGKNLKIVKDDPNLGAILGDLTETIITTKADALDAMALGNNSRHTASTNMNARSSRSHTVFKISIKSWLSDEKQKRDAEMLASLGEDDDEDFHAIGDSGNNDAKSVQFSSLTLVDLAGSERQKNTKATGKILKEGTAINKSLSALGDVISKLSSDGADTAHIPYRNSKLTRVLKHSLGGNSYTTVIIAMTPHPSNTVESISSLKFGQMCKKIKNKAKKGGKSSKADTLRLYKLETLRLKQEMEELKRQNEEIRKRDQLVLEHDKELESLVQEEHEHVEELVHEVEDMKKRDKMLEEELEKYKALVESHKSMIGMVAHNSMKAEREAVVKKLKVMKDIFLGSNEDAMKIIVEQLGTGATEEVKSLVDVAVQKITTVQDKREKATERWRQLRRISMPQLEHNMSRITNRLVEQKKKSDEFNQIREVMAPPVTSADPRDGHFVEDFHKHSRAMHDKFAGQLKDAKKENEDLNQTIEDLREDIIDKNVQMDELNATITKLKEEVRTKSELEDEIVILKEQILGLNSEKKRLLSHHSQETTNFEVQIEGLRADLKRNEEKMAEVNQDVAELTEEYKKNKLEKQDMKKSYDEQQKAIRNVQMKLLNATKKNGKRSRRMSMAALDLQWPAVEKAVDDFLDERKRLDKDIKRNENMKKEVDSTKARNRKWEREIDEKNEKTQQQLDALKHQQRELRTLKEDLDNRQATLKTNEEKYMEKDVILNHREQDIIKTETHLHNLETTLQEQSEQNEEEQEKLRADLMDYHKREHNLKVQFLKVDAATAIQRVIRQALLRKASYNSKKVLKKLADVEEKSKIVEAQLVKQREKNEDIHSKELQLNFLEEDLNRRKHDIDDRQARMEKLQIDLNKLEKQEKKIQDDLDKRTMEVASEQQQLNDWRQDLAKKDAENRDLEKQLSELKIEVDEKLKKQQQDFLVLEREKTTLAVERSAIKSRKQQIEEMTKIAKDAEIRHSKREEELHQLKTQISIERGEIRDSKAKLGAVEVALRSREESVDNKLAKLSNMKVDIEEREEKGKGIAAKLSQLERREHLLSESENEFYTRKAATLVKKYKNEINSLEEQLNASCDSVTRYKNKNAALTKELTDLRRTLQSSKEEEFGMSRETAMKSLNEARSLLRSMQDSMQESSSRKNYKTTRIAEVINVEL